MHFQLQLQKYLCEIFQYIHTSTMCTYRSWLTTKLSFVDTHSSPYYNIVGCAHIGHIINALFCGCLLSFTYWFLSTFQFQGPIVQYRTKDALMAFISKHPHRLQMSSPNFFFFFEWFENLDYKQHLYHYK